VFDQGENRLHTIKAILVATLGAEKFSRPPYQSTLIRKVSDGGAERSGNRQPGCDRTQQVTAGFRPLRGLVLSVVVLATVVSSCSDSPRPRTVSLLVVGDSVAAQAAEPLIHLAPPGTTVLVDAVQPGTAPCDWDHGFTDPTDHVSGSFASILRSVRPAVVAFVFTGNPGLSGPSSGCVDADSPYDLPQLLASYEPPLLDMANRAVRTGATVFLEAPPPRNPAVPVGYDDQLHIHHGFQGSPAIGSFYKRLVATRNPRHWRYDDAAAVAVSSASLSWMLTLPCLAWDAKLCRDGQIQVREGGVDAVHLDTKGCGAIRFALGLEERALATTGRSAAPPDASSVAEIASQYGGCQ
jgi:hypothetical protein